MKKNPFLPSYRVVEKNGLNSPSIWGSRIEDPKSNVSPLTADDMKFDVMAGFEGQIVPYEFKMETLGTKCRLDEVW